MYIGSSLKPHRRVPKKRSFGMESIKGIKAVKINPVDLAIGFVSVLALGLGSYFVITVTKVIPKTPQVAGIQTNNYAKLTDQSQSNLIQTIAKDDKYKLFYDALTKTGVIDLLKTDKAYTVFVPTDDAFNNLGTTKVNALLQNSANIDELTKLVKNHIVQGSLSLNDLLKASSVTNLNGESMTVAVGALNMTVGNANIQLSDIQASNGMVFQVNNVIE